MKTNDMSLVDLINQNNDERQELLMEFAHNRTSFEELHEGLNRLEVELEIMNYNWVADNRIVMQPFELLAPDELLTTLNMN